MWNQLPWAWPDPDADGRPTPDGVAEWLGWVARDAQDWWGGLLVTTDRGSWRFGDPKSVRTILAGASQCRITRQADGPEVLELILSRLPEEVGEPMRQQIAAIRAVDALATPLIEEEVRELIRLRRCEDELAASVRNQRDPPPVSRRPLASTQSASSRPTHTRRTEPLQAGADTACHPRSPLDRATIEAEETLRISAPSPRRGEPPRAKTTHPDSPTRQPSAPDPISE